MMFVKENISSPTNKPLKNKDNDIDVIELEAEEVKEELKGETKVEKIGIQEEKEEII